MFSNIAITIVAVVVLFSSSELVRWIKRGRLRVGTKKALMVGLYLYTLACVVIDPLILRHIQYRFHDLNGAFVFIEVGMVMPIFTLILSLKLAQMLRPLPVTQQPQQQQDNLIFASVVLAAVALVFLVYRLYFPPRIAILVIVLLFALPVIRALIHNPTPKSRELGV